MIELLRIEQLALVDRVELEFGPGLNVVTGETGAGKSVVLGALGMLAGARTSAAAIREGADQAVVEAVFRTDRLPELEAELAERGLAALDHELVVRRTLSKTGRSRAQVGGALVPIATLAELFAGRIEISSQHESQALLRPETQSRVLDEFGGLRERCARVRAGVAALAARAEEAARLQRDAEERARREDFLAFQMGEIDDARLDGDEIESIADDRRGARKLVKNTDFFVAEAPLMPTIGKRLGVFLGPKGKMPRPLPPGADPGGLVDILRKTVRVRSRDKLTIHVPVGTTQMSPQDVAANVMEILRRIEAKTPRGPGNIASVYVKTTMGPSVKVE